MNITTKTQRNRLWILVVRAAVILSYLHPNYPRIGTKYSFLCHDYCLAADDGNLRQRCSKKALTRTIFLVEGFQLCSIRRRISQIDRDRDNTFTCK